MAPHRRELLRTAAAVGAAGLGSSLAGCLGGQSGATPTDTTTEDTTTATTTATTEAAPVVTVAANAALGDILADADGRTLYVFERDADGESACYGDCASAWPPLTVESEAAVEAGSRVTTELGTTERDGGSLQVTAGGMPLYYFAGDEDPGDVKGQELGNAWFALHPDGSVHRPTVSTRELPDLGAVLTDADGRTLYVFERDADGESACYGDCASAWPPLTVESEDALVESVKASVSLDTTERDGGSLQATAAGMPLYYFAQDEEPGDANGQGVGDVWYVLRPDGSVVRGE